MVLSPFRQLSARLVPQGRVVAITAFLTFLSACDDPDRHIAGPIPPPNLQAYVTGNAAASLDAKGRFNLAAPVAPGARPIISAQRAGELALAAVRSWGPSLRGAWEKERGEPISLSNLQVGPRTLFARTPYGAFPEGYHPALGRAYGPYYLVTLYSGAEPVLLISVAAYNEEAKINERGLVERPMFSGMEFITQALPRDTTRFRMVSPEEAVEMAGRMTGARVTTTPELVRLGMPNAPASAAWKLTLDREVPVKARSGGRRVRELYVTPERNRRLMVAVPSAARVEHTSGVAMLPSGERIDPVSVPIVEGEVISFEAVATEQGGN